MKSLTELINKEEPGWELVSDWITQATNKIEVLKKIESQADTALYQTQVTTRSPMGAIIFETGGILVDNGWIRILGSGNESLNRSLPSWNKGRTFTEFGEQPSILLIADDAVGGFFGINGGALGNDLGTVYYFAPDTLSWEPMDFGYSDFVWWTFTGNLSEFYSNLRWTNWEKDLKEINGNQAISFYPFLWVKHDNIDELSRKPVPVSEIWSLHQDLAKQLDNRN
ncbi:DUF2625 domain-containing protein [Flagellimonas sp.]|uniref:DUF2625 domain-containing protein n=1 Tax=Flagellimonas sp. TaxID=2058762 RepID=UPI003B50E8B3